MTKYNIEGGIDFYSELHNGLDIPESNGVDENVCLITNTKLLERYVKMKCDHTFNYEPLYKYLVNHRLKFNNMERASEKLKTSEIRCPYCRSKQKGLLQYYPDLGFKKIVGVNTLYIPPEICSFIWDNPHFDTDSPDEFVNPKTIKCMHIGSNVIHDGEKEHYYCIKHNKIVLAKQAKALKEQQKQDKISAKIAAKMKLKEDAALAKASKKALSNVENVIIATNVTIYEYDPLLCVEILRSGDRKGQQCIIHKIHGQDRCKRHYNLLITKNL
jgi:hypothetical protein